MVPSDKDLKLVNVNKSLSDKFRHNQPYPGIIQAYSKLCVTLAYLEPWYI